MSLDPHLRRLCAIYLDCARALSKARLPKTDWPTPLAVVVLAQLALHVNSDITVTWLASQTNTTPDKLTPVIDRLVSDKCATRLTYDDTTTLAITTTGLSFLTVTLARIFAFTDKTTSPLTAAPSEFLASAVCAYMASPHKAADLVLVAISRTGTTTTKDAGRLIGKTASATTPVACRLAKAGLVIFDENTKTVAITKAGHNKSRRILLAIEPIYLAYHLEDPALIPDFGEDEPLQL